MPFWKWTQEATGKNLKEKFKPLWADLLKEQARRMAELKKLHVPVTHTITIEPVK